MSPWSGTRPTSAKLFVFIKFHFIIFGRNSVERNVIVAENACRFNSFERFADLRLKRFLRLDRYGQMVCY